MIKDLSLEKAFLAVAVFLWSCSFAIAGPALIVSSDPRGDEVRGAAREFYEKVAAGDAAGAKAVFDGPPEQAELLEAHLRFVKAGDELQRTLASKFGKIDDKIATFGSMMVQARADRVASEAMTLNGDRASIAYLSPTNCGTDLRRVDGKWKVTHLTTIYWKTPLLARFLDAFVAVADDIRGQVADGKITTEVWAREESAQRMKPVFLAYFEAEEPTATGTGPATTQPAPAPVASAVELQQLIGKEFASPEVQRVFQALPGAPHISTFPEPNSGFYLKSPQLGIELRFSLPSGSLAGVALYAEGSSGFMQYNGALPAGLLFTDSRGDVEKKLGPPVESGGGMSRPYFANYADRGIEMTYARPAARDPANPIGYITLYAPRALATTQPATRPVQPRVSFRLVASNPRPNDPAVEMLPVMFGPDRGTTLPVSREVLFDERDILKLAGTASFVDTRAGVSIVLTPESAKQFEKATAANVHKRIALVFDGKVVVAATINGPISNGSLELDFGSGSSENAECHEIIVRLHAAVMTLPTTAPSKSDDR